MADALIEVSQSHDLTMRMMKMAGALIRVPLKSLNKKLLLIIVYLLHNEDLQLKKRPFWNFTNFLS